MGDTLDLGFRRSGWTEHATHDPGSGLHRLFCRMPEIARGVPLHGRDGGYKQGSAAGCRGQCTQKLPRLGKEAGGIKSDLENGSSAHASKLSYFDNGGLECNVARLAYDLVWHVLSRCD